MDKMLLVRVVCVQCILVLRRLHCPGVNSGLNNQSDALCACPRRKLRAAATKAPRNVTWQ